MMDKDSILQNARDLLALKRDAARYRFLRVSDNWPEETLAEKQDISWANLCDADCMEFDIIVDKAMNLDKESEC